MVAKALVVGGTGSVGGPVVSAALSRGDEVRVLVRNESRAGDLPRGAEPFVGDLTDERSIRSALSGVQSVFYVLPHMDDEVEVATSFVRACEDAGVRLVFGGLHIEDPAGREAFGEMLPRYRGKVEVGVLVAESRTNPVIFNLTNFMQNDDLFREDLLSGVYPLPLSEAGANRLDLRDAGEIAARALAEEDFPSGVYGLQGRDMLNGPECARVWSEELGRPVRYVGGEDGEWQAAFERRLSGAKLTDFLYSFDFLRRSPWPTDPEKLETTTRLLGRPPRTYREYVRDTVQRWRAS